MYSLPFHQINVSPKTFKTPLLIASYYEKNVPTSATKPPYSRDQESVSSHPVTVLSFASYKTSGRAALVPCSIFPSNSVDSSVNSFNSFYATRPKTFSFKSTKSLAPKSLTPFESSVCIKSSVNGAVSNGAVSDVINTLQGTCARLYF